MAATRPTHDNTFNRKVLSVLWRGARGFYYWPVQAVRHGLHLARHGSDAWYRITAPWMPIRGRPTIDESLRHSRPASWYRFEHKFTFEREHVRFDIDYAIHAGDVKGLALIFFMGAGDYFFTTPLLAALRQRYPDLPIIAFATIKTGEVNSPLVPELLSGNPDINEVRLYDGKQTRRYKNYDYSDALRLAPANYLTLPVLYEHLPSTRHRIFSLFDTFGLARPEIALPPVIHLPPAPPPHVSALAEGIKQRCGRQGARGVVFLQTDSRASHYAYPYASRLAEELCARGFFVVSASQLEAPPPLSHVLDFKEFAMMDSIHLLALLREAFAEVYIVSVASVFWSVSSGLGIPNLGMQHFPDDAMHNYWYPNIAVVTHRDYENLPPAARFLAKPGDYTLDERGLAVFAPDFVMKCFDRVTARGVKCEGGIEQDLRVVTS